MTDWEKELTAMRDRIDSKLPTTTKCRASGCAREFTGARIFCASHFWKLPPRIVAELEKESSSAIDEAVDFLLRVNSRGGDS